jgi:hypothetical protein
MSKSSILPLLLTAAALAGAAFAQTQYPGEAPYYAGDSGPGYDNFAPPPPGGYQDYTNDYDDSYSDEPEYEGQLVYADQPPPPLPEYSQPLCPGDDYLWTPGYWSYAYDGYYWVPGTWVLAPYVDALWTPPYWEFYGNRYRWHRGYWGNHVGFYGGINYGFGYTGRGYYGGYWSNGRFAYNRAVTNVNITIVHNVYSRNVNNFTNTRVSYNGPGGVNVRPIPAELAVLRETRIAPLSAQIQHSRTAASNRAQFAAVNRGRPQMIVQAQPLATGYRAPAVRPAASQLLRPLPQISPRRESFRPGQGPGQGNDNRFRPNQPLDVRQAPQPVQRQDIPRPEAPRPDFQRGQVQRQDIPRQDIQRPENARPAPPPQARPEFTRPPAQQPLPAPVPQARPQVQPDRQRGQSRPGFEGRPAPETRPQPQVQPAQPQQQPQAQPERQRGQFRPGFEGRPAPEARPQPQVQPAQPQQQPQARPAPPAQRGGDRGEGRGRDRDRP